MATPHRPPDSARATLGAIETLVNHALTRRQNLGLHGAQFVCRLPGGELYFESGLELDTDGSRFAKKDKTGQSRTSALDKDGRFLDANAINYMVLPEGGFTDKFGIKLGDIAAVIFGDRLAFAFFGDSGPAEKLGEGSIALHRELGFERTRRDGTFQNAGIDGDVVTIVFPNSAVNDITTPEHNRVGLLNFQSRDIGSLLLFNLNFVAEKYEQTQLTWLAGPRRLAIPAELQALQRLLRPWVEEIVARRPHPETIDSKNPVDYLLVTADGLDVLASSAPIAMAGGKLPPPPLKTVYAQFDLDTDKDKVRTDPAFSNVTFPANLEDEAQSVLGLPGDPRLTRFMTHVAQSPGWTQALADRLFSYMSRAYAPRGFNPHATGFVFDLDFSIWCNCAEFEGGRWVNREEEKVLGAKMALNNAALLAGVDAAWVTKNVRNLCGASHG